ncbi:hypothetical protein EMPS_10569 [Entomortierella parvispora]|uniref:Uncharacterized protein n=1 Tax=Entomortierella parvispora TaxID=205924 RepID=A0A9P3HK53_9FUNG|nr:hypothetical protein EMPS_10569 [Entomortierella parvispora]
MAKLTREKLIEAYDKQNILPGGYSFFDDRENGIMYLLHSETVDSEELDREQKAQNFEYFRKNYTFRVLSKDLQDKSKWEIRESLLDQ